MRLLARWAFFLLLIAAPCFSLGQGRERIIAWGWQSPTPIPCPIIKNVEGKIAPTRLMALEVISLLVSGKPVTLGQSFVAGDDWMKDFKVQVRNVSGHSIIHVWLHFSLPEAKNGEAITGFSLDYGRRFGNTAGGGEQKLVLPGEEFELTHSEAEYERDKRWIAEWSGVTSISRVRFGEAVVRFEDETVWAGWPRIRNTRANPQCP